MRGGDGISVGPIRLWDEDHKAQCSGDPLTMVRDPSGKHSLAAATTPSGPGAFFSGAAADIGAAGGGKYCWLVSWGGHPFFSHCAPPWEAVAPLWLPAGTYILSLSKKLREFEGIWDGT